METSSIDNLVFQGDSSLIEMLLVADDYRRFRYYLQRH